MEQIEYLQVIITARQRRRFWSQVVKRKNRNGKGCWIWKGLRDPRGYGRVWMGDIGGPAHRVAFLLARGPIPPGLLIRHLCHNKSCVRPTHLEPGTVRDNWQDEVKAGRGFRRRRKDAIQDPVSLGSVHIVRGPLGKPRQQDSSSVSNP